MQMRHKNHTTLLAAAGVYQVRGDVAFKLALLLIIVHAISANVATEFKAAAAVPAPAAQRPSLKVFIAGDGSLHLDSTSSTEATPADFKAALSNVVAQANGGTAVIALCLADNPMAKAIVGAGLVTAQVATNSETVLTLNTETHHDPIN